MKLPEARKGMPVIGILVSIINYLRANTIQNVIGGKLRRSPSGITIEIDRAATRPTKNERDHPWKATLTSDGNIAVSAGSFFTYRDATDSQDLNDPFNLVGFFLTFAGGQVTPDGEGFVYAVCDLVPLTISIDNVGGSITLISERQIYSGTPGIVFSNDNPATISPMDLDPPRSFAIPIARIGVDDDENPKILNQFVTDTIPPIGGSYTYEQTPN